VVTDADFEDLKESFDRYKKVVDTLLVNLLQPALDVPGTLRFGGNVMQLDNQGIQIVTNSSINAPALFYVPAFSTDADATRPYAVLTGGANVVAGNEDVAALEMGIYPDTGLEGQVGLQSFNTATGVVGAFMSVESGGVISDLTLLTSAGVATLQLNNAVPIFSVTADPVSFTNGMIWYNSTSNLLKARINGSTVTLGGTLTTLLLTDTAWAAAGDMVYGTGNDTATILSGSSEDAYYLRYNTAVNAPVWTPWLKVSNQTGDFAAAAGNFYRVTATATVTMPNANADGRMLRIINVGSGTLTVNRAGSDTFFYGTTGLTSHTILPGECFTYTAYAGGTEWLVS
jgi:hypothetical protein